MPSRWWPAACSNGSGAETLELLPANSVKVTKEDAHGDVTGWREDQGRNQHDSDDRCAASTHHHLYGHYPHGISGTGHTSTATFRGDGRAARTPERNCGFDSRRRLHPVESRAY